MSDFYKDCRTSGTEGQEFSEQRTVCVRPHNHEFSTSTDYARDDENRIHNHRVAGVTGPAIPRGNTHVHKVKANTDTFIDHHHEICDYTEGAIYLPSGKHFHIVKGKTSCNDGHDHEYYFITSLEDPTNVPKPRRC